MASVLGPQDYFLHKVVSSNGNGNNNMLENKVLDNADLGIANHTTDLLYNYRDDKILLSENLELKNNNEFYKTLVSKLQDFLKVYQIKYPELNVTEANTTTASIFNDTDLPPWLSHSRYLSPLLVAYEARIVELTTLSKNSQDELNHLQQTAAMLVSQNESLQNQLENKMESLIKRLENPHMVAALSGGSNNTVFAGLDDVREMQHHLELLMQESELMRDQEINYKKEIVKLTTENQEKTEGLNTLANEYANLTNMKNQLQLDNQILLEERSKNAENFTKFQALLSDTEEERDNSLNILQKCQTELKSLQTAFIKKQTQSDESITKYQTEITQLTNDLQQLSTQNARHTQDIEQFKFKIDSLTSEKGMIDSKLSHVQREHDVLLQTMKSIQEESNSRNERVKQLSAKISDINEAYLELKVERDIFKAREIESRGEVQSLEERLSSTIGEVRKQCEIDKNRYFEKVKENEERMTFETRAIVLNSKELEEQKERLLRDKQNLESAFNKLSQYAKQDQAALLEQINGLLKDATTLKNERDNAIERASRHSMDIKQERESWQKQKDSFDMANTEYRRLLDQKDVQLATFSTQLSQLSTNLNKAQSELKKTYETTAKLEENFNDKLNYLTTTSKREVQQLQSKNSDLENQLSIVNKHVSELVNASKRYESQSQLEFSNLAQNNQRKINELKDNLSKLQNYNDELKISLSNIKRERDEFFKYNSENEIQASHLNNEVIAMQKRLADSALLLQSAMQREQNASMEARSLSQQLNHLELEKKRTQRQLDSYQKRKDQILLQTDLYSLNEDVVNYKLSELNKQEEGSLKM